MVMIDLPEGRHAALDGVVEPYPPEVRRQVGLDAWRRLAAATAYLAKAQRYQAEQRPDAARRSAEAAADLLAATGDLPPEVKPARRALAERVEELVGLPRLASRP